MFRTARVLERSQRLVDALGGQLERAEMHADALGGAEIQVRLHRLCRIHVNGLHEPARLVGADREKGQIDRTEPLPDIAKERRIRRVAGEIISARRAAPARIRPTGRGFDRTESARRNDAPASA